MDLSLTDAHCQSCAEPFASVALSKPLRRRLRESVERLARAPSRSLPDVFPAAGYKAFSRLVNNPRLHEAPLLDAVCDATRNACEHEALVLVIHDTTEVRFGGATRREGLGRINTHDQGFLCHVSLAVSAQGARRVFGPAAVHSWVRPDQHTRELSRPERNRRTETEQDRWHFGVRASAERLGDSVEQIHITDREADEFEYLAHMRLEKRRLICRQRQPRNVRTLPESSQEDGTPFKSTDLVRQAPVTMTITVPVQARLARGQGKRDRTHPPRTARAAALNVHAQSMLVQRPKDADRALPTSIPINLVCVRESNPPADQPAIEWLLWTTEPIESAAQLHQVVEWYARRWIVEEWFKGLKTGCKLEERQLESYAALQVYLALVLPIATMLLNLRNAAEEEPEQPAETMVDADTLAVLRSSDRMRLPTKPTATAVLYAIAALGGHFRHNGAPGWLVLMRGMERLHERIDAYRCGLRDAKRRATENRGQ